MADRQNWSACSHLANQFRPEPLKLTGINAISTADQDQIGSFELIVK